MATKKPHEKLTIDEYKKLKELQQKRRFKIEFYPWPVMVALGIPLVVFIFLILVYILHVQGMAG
ncbi:MAG: hypothetical protein HQL22_00665 [Candidatus Omnitrophica bacterium]|nr:hypothetical protein [Candidatus Omnitrophota bacterium]